MEKHNKTLQQIRRPALYLIRYSTRELTVHPLVPLQDRTRRTPGRRREADGRQDGRRQGRLPEGAWRRVRRGQGGRRGTGVRPDGVQGRLREGQDRLVKKETVFIFLYILIY